MLRHEKQVVFFEKKRIRSSLLGPQRLQSHLSERALLSSRLHITQGAY